MEKQKRNMLDTETQYKWHELTEEERTWLNDRLSGEVELEKADEDKLAEGILHLLYKRGLQDKQFDNVLEKNIRIQSDLAYIFVREPDRRRAIEAFRDMVTLFAEKLGQMCEGVLTIDPVNLENVTEKVFTVLWDREHQRRVGHANDGIHLAHKAYKEKQDAKNANA